MVDKVKRPVHFLLIYFKIKFTVDRPFLSYLILFHLTISISTIKKSTKNQRVEIKSERLLILSIDP